MSPLLVGLGRPASLPLITASSDDGSCSNSAMQWAGRRRAAADVRSRAVGSGSRNAGWPPQLLTKGPPLALRDRHLGLCGAAGQDTDPLWGKATKASAAASRRSNFAHTRARDCVALKGWQDCRCAHRNIPLVAAWTPPVIERQQGPPRQAERCREMQTHRVDSVEGR